VEEYGVDVIGKIGKELYFTSQPGGISEIWKTDGTIQGTKRVRTLDQVPLASAPATKGVLYFSQNRTLYRTDGTAEGTYVVDETHKFWSSPSVWMGNQVYFSDSGLWCSDGTPGGTRRLLEPLEYRGVSYPVVFKGKVFVFKPSKEGYELWSTDGTLQGTQLVVRLASSINGPVSVGTFLYFYSGDDWSRLRLWRTDGTAAGTKVLGAESFPGYPYYDAGRGAVVVGSTVYFSGSTEMEGKELWRTDGTAAGTYMVADLTGDSASSEPGGFGLLGSQLLFWATTSARGRELYSLDVSADLAPPP